MTDEKILEILRLICGGNLAGAREVGEEAQREEQEKGEKERAAC